MSTRAEQGDPGPGICRRARRALATVACLAAASACAAALGACGSDGGDGADSGSTPPIRRGDMVIVSLDRSKPKTYGDAAVIPRGDPRAPRRLMALKCARVAYAAGTGICLAEKLPSKAVPVFQATFFDARGHVTGSVDIPGNPSRARVSPGGRYAASTTFVSGDSYAPQSKFTTRTLIFDPSTARVLANLEDFRVERHGRRIRERDFNFWGVTFDGDSGRFYATLATGTHHFLVKGDLATKTAVVLRDGVECPSLSPDGTRIAFKARVGKPWQWRFHVLALKTGDVTALPEQRSVDDQIEWLDERRLVYDRDEVVMQVAADGRSDPQPFLPAANSPVVVR